ncbi:hypothetical protein CPER28S_01712 [Cellulomonas persica]
MFTTSEVARAGEARSGARSLAVALGVASATPPAIHLPPLTQRLVAGGSPLEATGWASPDDLPAPDAPTRR